MKPDLDAPADTRVMGIVHSALRRDLLRLQIVLGSGPPDDDRRVELADHALWMMEFLRHHHEGEDTVLYPRVVEHNPESADLVAQMQRDHALIDPAIDDVDAAARDLRDGVPGAQDVLEAALTRLSAVLLPHLDREERQMMPVVSASITDGEWRAWDDECNIKPKSIRQLGREGVWILDGLDAVGSDHLVHLVGPVPRFVMLHVLGPHNRHHFADLWKGTAAADVPSQQLSAEG
ncbi:hemerythrin domain-containing protein [Rhodococcus sp. NPDC054953]